MSSKSHHAKFLSSIKDVVQNSTDEENVSFIVGSLLLYEQSFATQNKETFRKLLSETLAVYGPGTPFDGDDRVLPLYILLGRYSRSSTHAEIFDRMNETGTYRKSAQFYVEWSKVFQQAGHSSRAREILHEGIKRKAKPESLLQSAVAEMGLESTTISRTPGRCLVPPPLTTKSASRSARKQLFPKLPANEASRKVADDFVLPVDTLPDPSRVVVDTSDNLTPLLPLPIDDETRSEDAENVCPAGLAATAYVKRKTIGILVPAEGFVLEDYDLAKVYEEEEKKAGRAENNRLNIENNALPSPGARSVNNSPPPSASSGGVPRAFFQPVNTASTQPIARSLFQSALFEPVLPPAVASQRLSPEHEDFISGVEAFKNLQPESDDEREVNDKRLTGFERLLQKRKSLVNRQSLAPSPKQPQQDPLEVLFSKMQMSSPSTSHH